MKKKDLLSRLVTPTGTKGCASHVGAGCNFCPGWCYQPGQKVLFCPGCHTRDKRTPPFIPDWRSRLGNRDNSGFSTGTNQRFCSSVRFLAPLPSQFALLRLPRRMKVASPTIYNKARKPYASTNQQRTDVLITHGSCSSRSQMTDVMGPPLLNLQTNRNPSRNTNKSI